MEKRKISIRIDKRTPSPKKNNLKNLSTNASVPKRNHLHFFNIFFRFRSWYFLLIIVSTISIVVFLQLKTDIFNFYTTATVFGWEQTEWGSENTLLKANHYDNRSGWTAFSSADTKIVASTSLSLVTTSGNVLHAANSDFTGSTTNVTINYGQIQLKKMNGRPCAANDECVHGNCENNECSDPFVSGPCTHDSVTYDFDYYFSVIIDDYFRWKTTLTACNTPQCALDGGQTDYLSDSNTVEFNGETDLNEVYPARQKCKDLGGRLISPTELYCLVKNQPNFGIDLPDNYYWTNEELSETEATLSSVYGIDVTFQTAPKIIPMGMVQCVRDR